MINYILYNKNKYIFRVTVVFGRKRLTKVHSRVTHIHVHALYIDTYNYVYTNNTVFTELGGSLFFLCVTTEISKCHRIINNKKGNTRFSLPPVSSKFHNNHNV